MCSSNSRVVACGRTVLRPIAKNNNLVVAIDHPSQQNHHRKGAAFKHSYGVIIILLVRFVCGKRDLSDASGSECRRFWEKERLIEWNLVQLDFPPMTMMMAEEAGVWVQDESAGGDLQQ